ncbi:MAG: heavy-metal-associated domain-containing protein [Verrucomicrobia bacterium]|nr:heavy-metal-associated domain-containing protein [Verrucomicrobiota bacterium]
MTTRFAFWPTLLLSLGIGAFARAAEPDTYTHRFSVAGVVCGACSKVVKDCVRKVDGVVSVKIQNHPEGGLPTLTVESRSPELDAATLQGALGHTSGHYRILAPSANVPPPAK